MEKNEQRNEHGKCAFYARVATKAQIAGKAVPKGETPKNNRKAYTYARVDGGSSSIPGADVSQAMLEAQSDRLRVCAEALGYEVETQEAELARMGITETAWEKMLKAAASGEVQAVMLTSCSRLHRDSEKAIDMLAELDGHGMQIYSQQDGWVNVPDEEGQPTMLQLLQMLRQTEGGEQNAVS